MSILCLCYIFCESVANALWLPLLVRKSCCLVLIMSCSFRCLTSLLFSILPGSLPCISSSDIGRYF